MDTNGFHPDNPNRMSALYFLLKHIEYLTRHAHAKIERKKEIFTFSNYSNLTLILIIQALLFKKLLSSELTWVSRLRLGSPWINSVTVSNQMELHSATQKDDLMMVEKKNTEGKWLLGVTGTWPLSSRVPRRFFKTLTSPFKQCKSCFI